MTHFQINGISGFRAECVRRGLASNNAINYQSCHDDSWRRHSRLIARGRAVYIIIIIIIIFHTVQDTFSVYCVPGSTPVPQNPMNAMVMVMVKLIMNATSPECYISLPLTLSSSPLPPYVFPSPLIPPPPPPPPPPTPTPTPSC